MVKNGRLNWGWSAQLGLLCLCSCGGFRVSPGVMYQQVVEPHGKKTLSAPLELAVQLGRDEGWVIGADSSLDWLLASRGEPQPKHDYSYNGFVGYAVRTPLRYLSQLGLEFDAGFGAGRTHLHGYYTPVLRPSARVELPIRPYGKDPLWKSERMLWPDIMVVPYFKATALVPTSGPNLDVAPQLGCGLWIRFHVWTSIAP